MSERSRQAQAAYEAQEQRADTEGEQDEKEVAQEVASRAAIACSPLFAKVEAEVDLLMQELQAVLNQEENAVRMYRAQGGIFALTKLLQTFTDAERTTPS